MSEVALDQQALAVKLHPGDIVLFNGKRLEHWREPFQGKWFISSIFAFVEQDGPNAYLKYDQRSYPAKPHIGMLRWSLGYYLAHVKRFFGQ